MADGVSDDEYSDYVLGRVRMLARRDKGFEAPPFERWLWDLLNAIWPDNGPESLDAEVMSDALHALSVLHETSANYKGLCR